MSEGPEDHRESRTEQGEAGGGRTTRRRLLGTAAATAPVVAGLPLAQAAARTAAGSAGAGLSKGDFQGKNVVIFLTDQERAIQHFPQGWARRNLPGRRRLLKHGVNFTHAYTNACMCTPARTSLMTGYFTAQTGCKYTLESDMPDDQFPQVEMSADFKNVATVMKAAGYNVVYKGKWHLSKPAGQQFEPSDAAKYGFDRWDPPDAGANQDVSEAGGGSVDNDGRFINEVGDWTTGNEGTLQYISDVAREQEPFCLIVSLVNPHDVLLWPRTWDQAGYTRDWLTGDIGLPPTVAEDLSTKPAVQKQFVRLFALGSGPLLTDRKKKRYLNFYANLIKSSDAYLTQVLDALQGNGLMKDTVVIRTADHGEMGLAHGGLRQKNFNMYEEATKVPLIFSNPRMWEKPLRCNHLVSHVDFLPTLASLFGAPDSARADWAGIDYTRSILDPENSKPPQDNILFTYDDYQSGQNNPPYPAPPNHVVGMREKHWKIVKYYDIEGVEPNEWEFYDLRKDPYERDNLADPSAAPTSNQKRQYKRMKQKLARAIDDRLQELPNTPQPLTPPSNEGTIPKPG